jgi:hypothetical protein
MKTGVPDRTPVERQESPARHGELRDFGGVE